MRLHPRRREPPHADHVLPVPDSVLSVAVRVGESGEAGTDLVQLYEAEAGNVRGRDAILLRRGEQVATVVDLPWGGGATRLTSNGLAPSRDG